MFTLFDQERVTEIAANEAAKEARQGSFIEVALGMLKKNMHLDVITDITHLSADEVRKIAADNGLSVV